MKEALHRWDDKKGNVLEVESCNERYCLNADSDLDSDSDSDQDIATKRARLT